MPEGTDASATDAQTETVATTTETTATETSTLGPEGEKALAAFKDRARVAEREAKAAKAELDKLREQTMSEQERAVSQAKAEGRTEALREAGTRLVDAEVRAAATGRGVDTDALLEGLDRSKFLDAEGEPDRDAIQAWIDRVAPAEQERGDGFHRQAPDLAQGTRSTAPALGSDPLTQSLKKLLGAR